MSGRDDQSRFASLHSGHVIRRQRLVPLVRRQLSKHSQLLQPRKGVFQIPRPQVGNHGLVEIGFLASDFAQFSGLQSRVLFQQA